MLPTADSFHSAIPLEAWHIFGLVFIVLVCGCILGAMIATLIVRNRSKKETAIQSDASPTTTKYFFSCVIIQNDGNLIHGSYAVDVKGEYPSQDEVKMVQNSVIKHVPNAKICTIIAISRLRA